MAGGVDVPKRYSANRPFGYTDELFLDRGQVFELKGARNDEKLTRLGFVSEVGPGETTYDCAECGAAFVGDSERSAHGRDRHAPQRELTPAEEDARDDRRERMLNEVAPLKLDKTAASRK